MENLSKVVILGHSGFIGSHLVSYFKRHSPELKLEGFSYPPFDLANEEHAEALKSHFDAKTAVIMLSGIKRNHGDTLDTFMANTKMVVNLCKAIEEKPVHSVIYFSSAAVYGEDIENRNISEETPVHPTTYYGMSKYVSERLLEKSAGKKSIKLLIVRPATIYGPNEGFTSYSPSGFALSMLHNQPITLWGDGSELREFIYIDDLVRAIYDLTIKGREGTLNIATGKSHTFKEILDTASRITGSYGAHSTRERTKAKVDHIFNISLLRQALPNFKFMTLEDGIKATIAYEAAKGGAGK